MHHSTNDEEESAAGGSTALPMEPPAGDWARASEDSWLCAALTELPRAIQRLPAAEQAAVIGYYFDDRPIVELAAFLGLEPARVEVILQQALRDLRRTVPH